MVATTVNFESHTMKNRLKTSNVNIPRLAAVLPHGMVLRVAAGMRCPYCDAVLRNHPEPLEPPGFRLLCDNHDEIFVFEQAS